MNKISAKQIREHQEYMLVVFGSETCQPCIPVKKFVEEICTENSINCFYINVEEEPELVQRLNISSIPVIVVYINASPIAMITGSKTKQDIKDFLGL